MGNLPEIKSILSYLILLTNTPGKLIQCVQVLHLYQVGYFHHFDNFVKWMITIIRRRNNQ